MGGLLAKPKTAKSAASGENGRMVYATVSMQGWRSSMEDAHLSCLSQNDGEAKDDGIDGANVFGVYDGHGGCFSARYCARHMREEIASASPLFAAGDVAGALNAAYLSMDRRLASESGTLMSGTTAVTAVVRGNRLTVANSGDSRCVLSRGGRAVELTRDHKPTSPDEAERIRKAGVEVKMGRVGSNLALSRAIGDFSYKKNASLPPSEQAVTCVPEIREETIGPDDEFLIIACDGIWDVLSCQSAVSFVRRRLLPLKYAAQQLRSTAATKDCWPAGISATLAEMLRETACQVEDRCLARDKEHNGTDNMTITIVLFKDSKFGKRVIRQLAERGPPLPPMSALLTKVGSMADGKALDEVDAIAYAKMADFAAIARGAGVALDKDAGISCDDEDVGDEEESNVKPPTAKRKKAPIFLEKRLDATNKSQDELPSKKRHAEPI